MDRRTGSHSDYRADTRVVQYKHLGLMPVQMGASDKALLNTLIYISFAEIPTFAGSVIRGFNLFEFPTDITKKKSTAALIRSAKNRL